VHIGIEGFDLPKAIGRPANLVFLLDVSGSMDEPQQAAAGQEGVHLLVNELAKRDRVSIVVLRRQRRHRA